jgi:hypothetical protein
MSGIPIGGGGKPDDSGGSNNPFRDGGGNPPFGGGGKPPLGGGGSPLLGGEGSPPLGGGGSPLLGGGGSPPLGGGGNPGDSNAEGEGGGGNLAIGLFAAKPMSVRLSTGAGARPVGVLMGWLLAGASLRASNFWIWTMSPALSFKTDLSYASLFLSWASRV